MNAHLRNAWPILIYLIGSVLLGIYLVSSDPNPNFPYIIGSCISMSLLFALPQFMVHMEYYKSDKNVALKKTDHGLVYRNGSKPEQHILLSKIDHILICRTHPMIAHGYPLFPWDHYFFVRLTINEMTYVLTSLVLKETDLDMFADKAQTKGVFIPFLNP